MAQLDPVRVDQSDGMGSPDIEVIQGLRIFAVERDGLEVRVDVYGGPDSVCGSLTYRFADKPTADDRARLLTDWCKRGNAVTYVCRDGSASLMDEQAVLSEALEP